VKPDLRERHDHRRSSKCRRTVPTSRKITHRELRNGVPVGELTPLRRRRFVAAEAAVALFRTAPAVDSQRAHEAARRFPAEPGREPNRPRRRVELEEGVCSEAAHSVPEADSVEVNTIG
jgi:hypothetical protein